MAFSARRSLATSLLSHHLTRRLHPSLSHLLPSHHGCREDPSPPPPHTKQQPAPPFPFSDDLRRRSRSQALALPLPFGAHRSFSSSAPEVLSSAGAGGGTDAATGALSEAGVDAATGVLAESAPRLSAAVASAAADWFPPVAALQHVLEAVHSFTGLNRWASIALTTVLTETSLYLIPLLLKSTMNSMDPRPQVGKKFGELLRKYGVNPSTLKVLKGFTRGSINLSLLLAILNMVNKVPSFKEGGAYWFTDLTTRDDLYILPVLMSMTIWALLELIIRQGVVENRTLQALKVYRVLIVLMIPFITFSKAVLIHTITGNLFSVGHFLALGHPAVRSYLNLPHLAPQRVPAQPQPPSYGFSKGPEPIPAVDSPVAVKGFEQSSSEPSDRILELEKKRRTSTVITNRVRHESTSSDER